MYKRYRFPSEIIQYTVWLYHRFNLNHRDIEDLIAQRGVTISYEAIRLRVISLVRNTLKG
jgi:putative transposase